jgi:hypothetical protein
MFIVLQVTVIIGGNYNSTTVSADDSRVPPEICIVFYGPETVTSFDCFICRRTLTQVCPRLSTLGANFPVDQHSGGRQTVT